MKQVGASIAGYRQFGKQDYGRALIGGFSCHVDDLHYVVVYIGHIYSWCY